VANRSRQAARCSGLAVNTAPDYRKTGADTPRGLGAADRDEKVVIVNEKTAAHFWPHENTIGKRVSLGPQGSGELEVVGVVTNVRSESLREDAPATYLDVPNESAAAHDSACVRSDGPGDRRSDRRNS
jgi:hypothetical protein